MRRLRIESVRVTLHSADYRAVHELFDRGTAGGITPLATGNMQDWHASVIPVRNERNQIVGSLIYINGVGPSDLQSLQPETTTFSGDTIHAILGQAPGRPEPTYVESETSDDA